MVPMHELTLRVDDRTMQWLERNRGKTDAGEFASAALEEHIRSCKEKTAVLHKDMLERLEDLERRIQRLNVSLKREHEAIRSAR